MTVGEAPRRHNRRARSRSRHLLAAAALVGLVLQLSGCAASTVPPPVGPEQATGSLPAETVAGLDAALEEARTLAGASGAIAGVWAPWAGQWQASPGSVGTALDPAAGQPGGGGALNTEMPFRIGTITTSMTCTVLLRLAEEERVRLDDSVSAYLARLPGTDGITLRQLCQNTSGLGQPDLDRQFVNNPTRRWPPLELVTGGLGTTRIAEPGRLWSRSDAGIQLLGMALQAATGQDWQELYARYLFEPLGMRHTFYPDQGQLDLEGAHPRGWAAMIGADGQPDCLRRHDVTSLSPSMSGVAGGVVSTLADLRIWSEALATGRLLAPESANQQWRTVAEPGSVDWRRFGLGAEQFGPMRGGAGVIPGYVSAMLSDPASGLSVVVMLNDSSAGEDIALAQAQQLAAVAAEAPAASGRPAVTVALPWTAGGAAAALRANAVCPAGAAETAAPAG
jgi:D-alanyl-D-alanine carboxypeptidase